MIVDPDFLDHWKTRMLVGNLQDEAAPIYVLRLWAHCQNRRQSTFDSLSVEALKALCRFTGDAHKLEAALTASGFVSRNGTALTICNWDEYNSSLIAAWSNGQRGGRPKTKPPKNQPDKPKALPDNPGVNPADNPSGTDGPTDKIGGEKSREEEIKESNVEDQDGPISNYLLDDEFRSLWNSYKQLVLEKHFALISGIQEQTILGEFERHSIEDAKEMLRFSMRVGAKSPIMNGDHKQPARKGRGPTIHAETKMAPKVEY